PSRLTSSTDVNSTAAPLSPSSFSTSMTCPGVTRYCLPPLAMTASMDSDLPRRWGALTLASVYKTIRRRPASTPRRARARRPRTPSRRLQVIRQLLPHEEPRPVHARLHRREADAQGLG